MGHYSWILQVILGLFFLMPGITKIKSSKETLVAKGNMKEEDPILFIRILGLMEILGVFAMIVPIWLKELHILTAVASLGFVIIMIGAFFVHFKKKEYKLLPILVITLIISVMVAINNF